jgi:hypothetical protein
MGMYSNNRWASSVRRTCERAQKRVLMALPTALRVRVVNPLILAMEAFAKSECVRWWPCSGSGHGI